MQKSRSYNVRTRERYACLKRAQAGETRGGKKMHAHGHIHLPEPTSVGTHKRHGRPPPCLCAGDLPVAAGRQLLACLQEIREPGSAHSTSTFLTCSPYGPISLVRECNHNGR
eukprot:363393-Chlamydomonas_euryale.AAC.2